MITLDLIRAGLVALMALPGMPFAGLCALFFCTVLLGTPFSSARAALLPEVLPGDKYPLGSVIGSHTAQLSQIAGFLAGGGLIAALGPYRALALDSLSFSLSAGHPGVRGAAPARRRAQRRPSLAVGDHLGRARRPCSAARCCAPWCSSAGWPVSPWSPRPWPPRTRTRSAAAHPPSGCSWRPCRPALAVGGFVIGRLLRPSDRMRPMGWLAMLSCAPLIFSLAHPPLPALILLWALAGAGGAYQLAAAAAFVTALPAARRVRAFAVAQTGLLAAQGLGVLTGGAVAQRVGAPGAVALAGLIGLLAAAALATDWTRRYAELIRMLDSGRVAAALAGTATDRSPGHPGPHRRGPRRTVRPGRACTRPTTRGAAPRARSPGRRAPGAQPAGG